MLDTLFSPCKIGNCTIPNRLVVPAMETMTCEHDGIVTDRCIKYHEEKAKGGWGLIVTEDYVVTPESGNSPRLPGLWDDCQIESNKILTQTVHKYGSKIFCQIYHSGKQTLPFVPWQAVAPSAIKDTVTMNMPRELTIEEIKTLVEAFGEATRRARDAGFDGVEVHAGHGYLIAQFLSSFVNKRTDEYGGCFENRTRFLDEIYNSMREKAGKDFPICIRISANEYTVGGRTEAETYQLAQHLDEMGVDAISVSNGAYAAEPSLTMIGSMFTKHAINMDSAGEIKKLVSCPVMVANRINDPKMSETLLKMDKADFICMGRGSLADPYLPQKAKEGKFEEINYCIGCLQRCEYGQLTPMGFGCLVNPRVGLEYEDTLSKTKTPKNIMVVGSGPAGMMAARTAAQRGHSVTLYEKDTHFGGAFRSAAYPMGKGELSTMISTYRKQCLTLGVTFKMGVEVNEDLIKSEKPDAIILATGSKPFMPKIAGIDGKTVVSAEDVLYGNVNTPIVTSDPLYGELTSPVGSVVVCGGGEVGGETAEFIAQTNPQVTLLEMKPEILEDMVPENRGLLIERMAKKKIKVQTNATVTEIKEDSVTYRDGDGREVTIPARMVVAAFGYKAYNPLEKIAKENCGEVYVVGSAVTAGNAVIATHEGYKAGLKV
ncbi:MAG: FAD-dependent oxidoreductase [Oscillospiraceae bacterium]